MLFNSVEFLLFLPAVTLVTFLLPARLRWVWLLAASWLFYGLWSLKYLALFIANTLVAYAAGRALEHAERKRIRRLITALALSVLVGTLFVFKYFDFVQHSAVAVLAAIGVELDPRPLGLELPIGVSFYTFQAIAYVVDVHRRSQATERHLGIFSLYKAFFPQLVAGPIERPYRLLPQLHAPKPFAYERLVSGSSLVLWGLAKKVVIADRLALYVNEVYGAPSEHTGLAILFATYLFAFQIYCDFSGYSDIAVGSARMLGMDLMQNFDRPYFSRSIREFWTRWHISLSSWFRDYVYLPLGGNRITPARTSFNIFVVFLVSGLWHGAAWTFVVWGALHGCYMLLGRATADLQARVVARTGLHRFPRLLACVERLVVFHLVCFGWLFFRAESFADAGTLLRGLTDIEWSLDAVLAPAPNGYELVVGLLAVLVMLLVHAAQPTANTAEYVARLRRPARWGFHYALIAAILIFGEFNLTEFIYFQF